MLGCLDGGVSAEFMRATFIKVSPVSRWLRFRSRRHWTDFLQGHGVTGLGGLDGEERRDGNQRTGERQGTQCHLR